MEKLLESLEGIKLILLGLLFVQSLSGGVLLWLVFSSSFLGRGQK